MDVADVLLPGLAAELADRLQERQRLDVADGAADLGDDDVAVARLRRAADPLLDLVRDVRDHLHRRAEVLAVALLADHAVPDGAGRVVRGAREVLVDEALVVADVEVGLGAVLGDEDLAVLERAHRPGSTLMYGSNFCICTFSPRALSSRPSEVAVMPLPSDETTPPVTKTYFGGRGPRGPPQRVEARRNGVRSISSLKERVSPRRLRPARAAIASLRPLP